MDQKSFGEFIANLRREAELTQRQVANTLHVTDRAVSKWERGLCYPDVTLLEPLATTLRVNVEDLLTCQRRISPVQGNELEALQSVLEISQGESRMRARRTRLWAFICLTNTRLDSLLLINNHPQFCPRRSFSCVLIQNKLPPSAFSVSVKSNCV